MAVVNGKGKLCWNISRATSEKNLIEAVSKVEGPREVVVEESHMAQWVKMTIEAYVDTLVVCDPRRNRWIAEADFSDDRTSAIKLAQLLRGGYIKEVYHPDDTGAALRSLFLNYYDLNHQISRFKCKLKATFRQTAIPVVGQAIYDGRNRKEFMDRLKGYPYLQLQAKQHFLTVNMLERLKEETLEAMLKKARKMRAFELLDEIPGAGPVISIGYIAMIITPERFSRKNKLWRYACLGNTRHESDDVVYKDRPSSSGNRVLKWVVVQHYQGAVERSKKLNRFKRRHQELLARGLSWKAARRHVCRNILSVVRAVWMKEEPYRDK
jgi:hypothetical protein